MSALAPAARIGPNAITRVAQALQVLLGEAAAQRVFERAQLAHYLAVPPSSMVDEAEVQRLHQALRAECDAATVRCVARLAGKHTGDYLLAHRIPRAAQVVLRALPSRLAMRVLLAAIGRHAWTFAGGGIFTAQPGRPLRLRIVHCPLCAGRTARAAVPQCDYYAATFERLLTRLVDRRIRVVEVLCEAAGDAACEFEARW